MAAPSSARKTKNGLKGRLSRADRKVFTAPTVPIRRSGGQGRHTTGFWWLPPGTRHPRHRSLSFLQGAPGGADMMPKTSDSHLVQRGPEAVSKEE